MNLYTVSKYVYSLCTGSAQGSTVCPKTTKTGNVPSAKTGSKLSEGPKERGGGAGGEGRC